MPPKRNRAKAKTQAKNFVVLSPYKFKELLENGTIKFESAQIDISRIQKPEVDFSMSNYLSGSEHTKIGNPFEEEEESGFKYEYEEQDNDNEFSDHMVDNNADQEVPTLKKWKKVEYTRICLECNKEFLSYLNLKRHYIDHHPQVPVPEKFICKEDQCAFRTNDKHTFNNHKRIHVPSGSGLHKQKPNRRFFYNYKCTECDTPFKSELMLIIHVNYIHRKLPLNCPVCHRLSKGYINLKQHVLGMHQNDNEYHCDQCDASFTMKCNLERHVAVVHKKERRFECPECGKRFGQKVTMKLHVQTVHLKIPYLPWVNKNKNRKRKLNVLSSIIY